MNNILLDSNSIYEFKCPSNIFCGFNEYFKSKVEQINWLNLSKKPFDTFSTSIGYENDNNVINFQPMLTWLKHCVQEVGNIHYTGKDLELIDIWYTKTEFSQSSSFHFHANSILSGLLYISESQTGTRFLFPDKWLEFLGPIAPYSTMKEIVVKPDPGKLLIWRSDLQHAVNVHKEKKPRYTLSFNTFFKKIESDNPAIRLKLNLEK